jgi:micrococcal nuclease
MLGINTPETVDPRKPAECFGKQASDETKKILKDGEVKIETDDIVGQFDKYNRLLAYVSLNNQDINAYLIEQGFAREYTYDTKKPYSKRQIYKQLQKEAKKNKRGLWSQCEAGKFAPR